MNDTARRVIAIPELLRNVLFSFNKHRDTYHAALVCRTWSEIALDVLWYEVDDLCTLFHQLVPLNDTTRAFNRRPEPRDWVAFERFSRRVKRLKIECDTRLPNLSVFDDIAKTRIRHEILPNLWSLKWFSEPALGVTFLHSGIQELLFMADFDYLDETKVFVRNAEFFSRNIRTLELQAGSEERGFEPHPIGPIEAELWDWFTQLTELRSLDLPRFWLTSRLCQVLGRLPHLAHIDFKWDEGECGHPFDTMSFNPISDIEGSSWPDLFFPSLIVLGQNAPFLEMTQFISTWQGCSRLRELAISSQLLETPDSIRSLIQITADHCGQLTQLILASLMSPYPHYPTSSPSRITLDVLLPVRKLKYLETFEVHHTLPFALSNEDFLVLIQNWPKLRYLSFGCDPYSPEEAGPPVSVESAAGLGQASYPTIGLQQSLKSLLQFCPLLSNLLIFGVDDFTMQGDQSHSGDSFPLTPFPNLTQLSFGTSSITSDISAVALALSQYLLPDTAFSARCSWGGDEKSQYLTFLNLKPLFPLRDQLSAGLQSLVDSADPDPTEPEWIKSFQNRTVNEPVGVEGVMDADTLLEITKREKRGEDIFALLRLLTKARHDEREKEKIRRLVSN